MDRLILHNERILPLEDARLSPGQAGLLTGWGVFTTLRIYHGRPFKFELHWHRMMRDAARLEVMLCHTEESVREAVIKVAKVNRREEGAARVSFIRNSGGAWAEPGDRPPTDLLVFTHALMVWPAVHRLCLQPMAVFSAGAYAGAKMLSWAPNTVFLEKARADGFDDALLVNEKGRLAECTSANVFLVRNGEVLTPTLTSGCLPGVTREVLFELAPDAGVTIRELELADDTLSSADEVFISSTTREVAAVSFINPKWNYPAPGPVTQRIDAAFRQYVERWIAEVR